MCPGEEAIDAFENNSGGEYNWWCLPPVLISHVGHQDPGGAMLGECTLLAIAMSFRKGFAHVVVDYLLLPIRHFAHRDMWVVLFNGKKHHIQQCLHCI